MKAPRAPIETEKSRTVSPADDPVSSPAVIEPPLWVIVPAGAESVRVCPAALTAPASVRFPPVAVRLVAPDVSLVAPTVRPVAPCSVSVPPATVAAAVSVARLVSSNPPWLVMVRLRLAENTDNGARVSELRPVIVRSRPAVPPRPERNVVAVRERSCTAAGVVSRFSDVPAEKVRFAPAEKEPPSTSLIAPAEINVRLPPAE